MKSLLPIVLAGISLGLASAQTPREPDIAYAYPPGGQAGTSVAVTVGGQFLEGMSVARVSGTGVTAKITKFSKPLPQKRFTEFRDLLAERRKQKVEMMEGGKGGSKGREEKIAAILQEAGATDEEIRLFRLSEQQKRDPKRQENKQLSESLTLQLDMAPDAAPGPRTLRLIGKNGLTNPVTIFVGNLPEESKPESTEPPRAETPTISFPVVLNGQILPGQTDSYRFHAARGEKLVFIAQARDLIPYLADAVPGWFEPVLTIEDAKGQPVISAQAFRFAPDPVLAFEVKESGDYELKIHDAIFRGREDFVYRLTAGKIPFVTGIFPLGGTSGRTTNLDVSGWNLALARVSFSVPAEPGIRKVAALANGFATMDVSFDSSTLPNVMAVEPTIDPAKINPIAFPVVINGRITSPGQETQFPISCKKGDPVVVEVLARRLNSPMDSFLLVTGPDGKTVASNDDFDDKENGLLTHHADSRVEFTPAADGRYVIRLGDSQRQGGADFAYRLRIDHPRPDFSLRVTPSGITGFPGSTVPITIFALRKDGFAGEIALASSLEGCPLTGARIPPGTDSIVATLAFPDTPGPDPQPIEITGTAEIAGQKVTRTAVPADDQLQAFIYHQLVPTSELVIYAPPGRGIKRSPKSAEPTLAIQPDGAARITVPLTKNVTKSRVHAELKNPPEGIWVESVEPCLEGVVVVLHTDPAKLKPAGNLIVELTAGRPAKSEEKDKFEKRWSLGILPAIPYQIAGK